MHHTARLVIESTKAALTVSSHFGSLKPHYGFAVSSSVGCTCDYGTWLTDPSLDSLEQPLAAVLPLTPSLILPKCLFCTNIPSSTMSTEPLEQHLSSREIRTHAEAWIPLRLKQAVPGSNIKGKDQNIIYKSGFC